jgi:hypothetical protein
MDMGTGLALLGTAKLVEKLLGPTAEYIGGGINTWAKKRVTNVRLIVNKAILKLGPKIDMPGTVPPKVLRGILDEGSFVDDELTREYFAGVLASSRSNVKRDNRGVSFITLLNALSNYQVRAHYIFYIVVKYLLNGSGLTFAIDDRKKMRVFIPYSSYYSMMDFNKEERHHLRMFREHVFFGLLKEGLIDKMFYGDVDYLRKRYKQAPADGVVFQPSVLGAELFLWAHGYSSDSVSDLLKPENDLKIETPIEVHAGCQRL